MSNSLSSKVERIVDNKHDISMREFLTKIYIRPRLFWSCVLVPVALALIFTALVPTSWKASVKIMLRYSSSESAFLRDLIPENRALLSGASSAEILKSIPTLVNTIREQDIQDEDIYKKPHEVMGSYVGGFLENFFPSSLPPGLPGVDPKTLLLAKAFKESLEDSSSLGGGSSKKKAVEVLEKNSQMPASMKGDELITVEVQSFNREKVAQMANGLAAAFIDEYYRVSAEDARRSYEFLNVLVEKAERDVREAEKSGKDGDVLPQLSSGHADISRSSPLLENMSKEMAALQNALIRAQGIYARDSEEVAQLQHQVREAQKSLTRQERIEGAKQALEQLKVRRFQALNTENLYKNRLVPISIVEPAFTPKKSFSKVAIRFVIAGAVGLVLGLVLAFGVIIVLDVTDPRLYTTWQMEKKLELPILAALPDLGDEVGSRPLEASKDSSLSMINGLLQILGRMKTSGEKSAGGRVIVIASASRGEGKTFISLALAGALGHGKRHKVLLIDANLQDANLSKLIGVGDKPGYVEAMLAGNDASSHIVSDAYRGCDILPAGDLAQTASLGFYSEALEQHVAALRQKYEFIVIDTAPVLGSNESLICGLCADSVLMVVTAGLTRKTLVQSAMQRLQEVGIAPEGLIMNRKKNFLPAFIYRNV